MNEPSTTTSSSSKRRRRWESTTTRPFDAASSSYATAVTTSSSTIKNASKGSLRSQHSQQQQRHYRWRTSLFYALQMIGLSSVIPTIFWIRYSWKLSSFVPSTTTASSLVSSSSESSTTIITTRAQAPNSPHSSSSSSSTTTTTILSTPTTTIHPLLRFLQNISNPAQYPWPGDIIELQHCDLTRFQLQQFQQSYVVPLLSNWSTMELQLMSPSHTNATLEEQDEHSATSSATLLQQQQQQQEEFVGQLLEMYAMDQRWCDFNLYRSTTVAPTKPLQKLQGQLAVVIVAYQDIVQLTELVDALYLPEHVYFIIHVDRHVDPVFQQQVQQLAETYAPYVHVVQFGTILYQTDTVTRINVQLLRWMTLEWELPYDFVVLLDGAAFPLVSATELLEHILERPFVSKTNAAVAAVTTTAAEQVHISPFQQVWLGAMTHRGRTVQSDQSVFLKRRRVLFTASNTPHHARLPRVWASTVTIPPFIQQAMQHKTHSGNVGIYSHHVIHKLLHSAQVMELLAYSKYSCCCCVEERNWVAALTLIGYQEQALKVPGSMFQLWGGETTCQGSMKNAVLARNESICYRTEDPLFQTDESSMGFASPQQQQQPHYIQGHELWDELVLARQRGYLFARKFSSDAVASVQLMNEIKEYLWDSD